MLCHRQTMSDWRPPPRTWVAPGHCRGSLEWVQAWGGNAPARAVRAGQNLDGSPIFVGRTWHRGDLLPAKVCPSSGCALVSYEGCQAEEYSYEVLVSDHVAWKSARYGEVPPEAIWVGQTLKGEPLYMGRTLYEGTLTPGKVDPTRRGLYITSSGKELMFSEYDVMVLD